jgi:hypothetical protein
MQAATLCLSVFLIVAPFSALAYKIDDTTTDVHNDFVLEPAKTDITLAPGESITKQLIITNRTDSSAQFTIEVEDFIGSQDPATPVVLLGKKSSSYSLKDLIQPEITSFTLSARQRIILSVKISIPANAEPQGRYGSLLVSTKKAPNITEGAGAQTISRIGGLYFVRIKGQAQEQGQLQGFTVTGEKKSFYMSPISGFDIAFTNTGNVHLLPHGSIKVHNLFGAQVAAIDIPAFFSLPDSIRSTQAAWSPKFMLGRYTATLTIARGYQEGPDSTDQETLVFWVLPWKIIASFFLGLVLLFSFIRFITGRLIIRRK